jgi:hypothetical protein
LKFAQDKSKSGMAVKLTPASGNTAFLRGSLEMGTGGDVADRRGHYTARFARCCLCMSVLDNHLYDGHGMSIGGETYTGESLLQVDG